VHFFISARVLLGGKVYYVVGAASTDDYNRPPNRQLEHLKFLRLEKITVSDNRLIENLNQLFTSELFH